MEFVLTGDPASGAEFERLGVVNKVFPGPEVVPAALKLAERIALMSGPVIKTAKQAVLTGWFTPVPLNDRPEYHPVIEGRGEGGAPECS